MTMTKVWNCGETELRRFNPRGSPYHISHDRYVPENHGEMNRQSSRAYAIPSHDHQQEDQDDEQDSEKGPPRRRIPVACNRCRKRKIRCSGPTPGDGSCSNCKSAGNGNCQFNRVSSSELPFIGRENVPEYAYDTFAGRNVQCRAVNQNSYPVTQNYTTGLMHGPITYRVPVADCQYSSKAIYIPNWVAEYGDDGDYGLSGAYSHLGSEEGGLSAAYNTHATRGWSNTPQIAKPLSNGFYYDSDFNNSYGQSPVSYQSHGYNSRPSVSAESNFSLSGMASSLPNPSPLINTDRVQLPPIPGSRTGHTIHSVSRSADGLPYNGSVNKAINTSLIPSSPPYLQPLSTSPENCGPYSTTSMSSSLPHFHQDMYNASNSEAWPPHQPTLRSQHSSSDMYSYGPTSDTSRKASQTGQSNVNATLANGQMYVPFSAASEVTRNTSLEISHDSSHRASNSSLRTA